MNKDSVMGSLIATLVLLTAYLAFQIPEPRTEWPLHTPTAIISPTDAPRPTSDGTSTPVLVRILYPPTSTPHPSSTALPSPTPVLVCGWTAQDGRPCTWPTVAPTPKGPPTPFPDCNPATPVPGTWCTWRDA